MRSEREDPVGQTEAVLEPVLAPGPLFVVSMWRSGSSLLYALLNKHPQVALMYEADLLLLRPAFLKPKWLCDWAERWEFWNEAFRRHGMAATDVGEGIGDFPSAFRAAHQLYAQRRGAAIWGDKSPNYYDRLIEMADDFPEARFILVWRDPKGTANSILGAASLGNSYFSRKGAAHCGLLGYEVFKKECDRLLARGKPVCQVNYEDLISETPAVMRRVCEFLQIPYDDSLAKLEGADRSAILDGQHHANLRGDKIVKGPRPELVGAALRAKISQYVAWWQQLYGAAWPPYPRLMGDVALPASELRSTGPFVPQGRQPRAAVPTLSLSFRLRLVDRAVYLLARTRDRISPVVFSFIPISLLRHYRRLKKGRREASGVVQLDPVDSKGVSGAAVVNSQAAYREGRP